MGWRQNRRDTILRSLLANARIVTVSGSIDSAACSASTFSRIELKLVADPGQPHFSILTAPDPPVQVETPLLYRLNTIALPLTALLKTSAPSDLGPITVYVADLALPSFT